MKGPKRSKKISFAVKGFTLIQAVLGMISIAWGSQITFQTPPGSEMGGHPVDVRAVFTTNTNLLEVDIYNLINDPQSIIQNLSALGFVLSSGETSGSLTSSSAFERTVNADGTYFDSGQVSTGWVLRNNYSFSFGIGLKLDVLNVGGVTPTHTLLGGPDPLNPSCYTHANPSIAGNLPHNPFIIGPSHFEISIPGLTESSTITGVVFSFGTQRGNDIVVPVPSTLILLGSSLVGIVGLRRRVRR